MVRKKKINLKQLKRDYKIVISRSFKFGMFEGFTTGAKKFYNNNKTAVDVSLGIAGAAAAAGATYVVLNNNNKKKIEESQQEILNSKKEMEIMKIDFDQVRQKGQEEIAALKHLQDSKLATLKAQEQRERELQKSLHLEQEKLKTEELRTIAEVGGKNVDVLLLNTRLKGIEKELAESQDALKSKEQILREKEQLELEIKKQRHVLEQEKHQLESKLKREKKFLERERHSKKAVIEHFTSKLTLDKSKISEIERENRSISGSLDMANQRIESNQCNIKESFLRRRIDEILYRYGWGDIPTNINISDLILNRNRIINDLKDFRNEYSTFTKNCESYLKPRLKESASKVIKKLQFLIQNREKRIEEHKRRKGITLPI